MSLLQFTFLSNVLGVIQPFSNLLSGGSKGRNTTKTNRLSKTNRTSNKKKKKITRRKKNLSRRKETRRKNLSKKRPINKRQRTKAKRKNTQKKRPIVYSKKKRQCNCDKDRVYIGNEPSPKGLGYCAHCTPLNVTMKGLDGNLWENQTFKKGKRWVKVRVDMN